MLFRFLAVAAFISTSLFAQTGAAPDASGEIKPDVSDPAVVRAQQSLERIQGLVRQGVLPLNSLTKAQDDVQDALDMSILRFSAYAQDLTPEQAEQMVSVAERMLLRRQRRVIQTEHLVSSGAISRAEAEASDADVLSAKLEYDLAMERAKLVQEIAESIRMQKMLAEAETDAESHPEMNGKLYTRYDGSGVFTRADFEKISSAFLAAFHHPIPVSADGQTAVHRALGFNHTGRIDIALSPDQPEGAWLMKYLERNRIPYFAFRSAIAHKATGAHIHLGPSSTKLIAALR